MTIIHAEHVRISWVERGGIYKGDLLTSHDLHMGQICTSEISTGASGWIRRVWPKWHFRSRVCFDSKFIPRNRVELQMQKCSWIINDVPPAKSLKTSN